MTTMFAPRFFDPASMPGASVASDGRVALTLDDQRSYVYDPAVILAVNVALATRRPLLLTGSPGSGKTTLAANVAGVLGWRFYSRVVTSRTKAQDLMWRLDALRRLADAQAGQAALKPIAAYIAPQILWWAFDARGATRRGAAKKLPGVTPAVDPQAGVAGDRAVVLLDEIDKAEPDVPNDLLETLDLERFTVDALDEPLDVVGDRDRVLMMVTSNGERDLPPAFIRRCVVLQLKAPGVDQLVAIAGARFGPDGRGVHRAIAGRIVQLREVAVQQRLREPSTAEYLDVLRACNELGVEPGDAQWALVEQSLLWKREAAPPPVPSAVEGSR